ncbi:MAG: methyltransferase domain-containing protein [Alphaproteobacteria bacterium]|nr:methyltransferase domain-containing protein [Alphaproteobacteria bacterium]
MAESDTAESQTNFRLTSTRIVREILIRTFLPHHVARRIGRRRLHRRFPAGLKKNTQLDLYSQMLRGDFLHYGYFDDANVPPERISFHDMQRAQLRYAHEILKLIDVPGAPVLDVGCGRGGMLSLLGEAGFDAIGLTPDVLDIEHIHRVRPGVPVLHCRFEDFPPDGYEGAFGTVIHAESIQYMNPARVLPVVQRILAPGGTWIVADYFRTQTGGERSGWQWEDFRERLDSEGFRIVHSRDITEHVLPTLGFARLLATRLGLPLFDYTQAKVQSKSPGLYYVLENILEGARRSVERSLEILDPVEFSRRKRYMLISIRREGESDRGAPRPGDGPEAVAPDRIYGPQGRL